MPAGLKPASSNRYVLQVHKQSTWTPVCMWTWSAGPCPADSKESETASNMSKWSNIAMRQQYNCLMKEGFSCEWPAGQLPAGSRIFFLQISCNFRCRLLVRDLPTREKQLLVTEACRRGHPNPFDAVFCICCGQRISIADKCSLEV